MYQIMIIQRTSATGLILWFKTSSAMTEQLAKLEEALLACKKSPAGNDQLLTPRDDYGHIQKIFAGDIASITVSDIKAEGEGHEEKQMIAQRAQKKLQDRMRNDPILNMATGLIPAGGGFAQ